MTTKSNRSVASVVSGVTSTLHLAWHVDRTLITVLTSLGTRTRPRIVRARARQATIRLVDNLCPLGKVIDQLSLAIVVQVINHCRTAHRAQLLGLTRARTFINDDVASL